MPGFSSLLMSSRTVGVRSRTPLLLMLIVCVALSRAAAAADAPARAGLTAEQIVQRHLTARGGAQAWRSVQTLSLGGKMDAGSGDSVSRSERLARGAAAATVIRHGHAVTPGGSEKEANPSGTAPQVQLPFRLEMKRPGKSRLEIDFAGQTAVQVFDGAHGWKLRPYLNRNDVEPFTADEAKAISGVGMGEFEGPLVDYAAKGTQVQLEGQEPVEGHNTYRLKLTLKDGTVRHVWIDAQSFLDVKIEGTPRRMDGRMHNVFVYQRDFRGTHGLTMPHTYETAVEGFPDRHRMIVETVGVNPALEDNRFAKPQVLVAGSPAATPAAAVSADAPKK